MTRPPSGALQSCLSCDRTPGRLLAAGPRRSPRRRSGPPSESFLQRQSVVKAECQQPGLLGRRSVRVQTCAGVVEFAHPNRVPGVAPRATLAGDVLGRSQSPAISFSVCIHYLHQIGLGHQLAIVEGCLQQLRCGFGRGKQRLALVAQSLDRGVDKPGRFLTAGPLEHLAHFAACVLQRTIIVLPELLRRSSVSRPIRQALREAGEAFQAACLRPRSRSKACPTNPGHDRLSCCVSTQPPAPTLPGDRRRAGATSCRARH
eukprot:scaffold7218_cov613-Prasinococcus_capsulatus_cf.AAC.6